MKHLWTTSEKLQTEAKIPPPLKQPPTPVPRIRTKLVLFFNTYFKHSLYNSRKIDVLAIQRILSETS